MKNTSITTLFIFFILFVSCESESETKDQPLVLPATNANTTPVSAPVKNENTNATATTLPVLNNTSAVALNPEHGKPGHRCDIAVGAPLNSAPANKTATPILNPTTPGNATPATAVAPGMNPQHGQPGHRCDIAVGAPLNSPPNKAATPPVTAAPVINTPVTATAPGMNPQHGQPGHRCDIAVGAPLDSKLKQ